MSAWKDFELTAARLFRGARFWANSGAEADFEGAIGGQPIRGQCKLVKVMPLAALTRLAETPGVDVVCVKLRRGKGHASPALVVMTFEAYRRLHPS